MMRRFSILFFSFLFWNIGFSQLKSIPECSAMMPAMAKQGFLPNKSLFSTSENKKIGLWCIEFSDSKNPKKYQHPSWKMAGWLSPIVIDKFGNLYTGPAPMTNTLYNDPQKQNIIYRVDAITGVMSAFLELPRAGIATPQNPYGILGMTIDCENGGIYVSSVAGSTRTETKGKIFSIKLEKGKPVIIDSIAGIDAFGLGVAYKNNAKKLFFGLARSSDVFSVGINQDGKFFGKPELEFSLEDIGARGDDRVRKIKFSPDGNIILKGVEFYFNLISPTEKQESTYTLKYIPEERHWMIVGIN
jgi:hypothetical protein